MSEHFGDHIKAVFFDNDDTLIGTFDAKKEQHKLVADKHYGRTLTDKDIRKHWGLPLTELLGIFYDTQDTDAALTIYSQYADLFPKKIFEATVPMLRRVKASGRIIGIVTATTRANLDKDLEFHGIPKELIDYSQTADETKYHKPDRRVFEPSIKWLAARCIAPNETLYIGDSMHDMNAALGAGFNFLGVETGLTTAAQFSAAGTKSIPSIAQLEV